MIPAGLQLRHLSFHGVGRTSAQLRFGPGLNIIYGSSDTGKSFIVESLDFMLGAKDRLREIKERIGYDQVLLALETLAGEIFTLQRSTDGGAFRVYAGLHIEPPAHNDGATVLAQKHNDKNPNNLSSYLLSRCDLGGKRLRSNSKGETNSLSFRNIARLLLVTETEIIKQGSPIKDGNPINDTPNFATFKLLLTGVDDSSLITISAQAKEHQSLDGQVALLDELIKDYESRLAGSLAEPAELESQLVSIESALSEHVEQLSMTEAQYRTVADRRGDLRKRVEEGRERRNEIDSLITRFELLDQHYVSDLERLLGLEEGGSLFEAMDQGRCPLCGADADHHRHDADSLVNVGSVIEAARAERERIEVLRRELGETIERLRAEGSAFARDLPVIEAQLVATTEQAERLISPELGRLRSSYRELADARGTIREKLTLARTIHDMRKRRSSLKNPEAVQPASVLVEGDLPVSIAEDFALNIEAILRSWHFPETGRVHFDAKSRDLIVAGKHRGARGKGLRAITHAAFSIGIMDFCRKRQTPHPGFVVLDSPLLAYREPDGPDDDLGGTDLKEQFYSFLASVPQNQQVVIFENDNPPEQFQSGDQVTFFSKNPRSGRYGFFPVVSNGMPKGS